MTEKNKAERLVSSSQRPESKIVPARAFLPHAEIQPVGRITGRFPSAPRRLSFLNTGGRDWDDGEGENGGYQPPREPSLFKLGLKQLGLGALYTLLYLLSFGLSADAREHASACFGNAGNHFKNSFGLL